MNEETNLPEGLQLAVKLLAKIGDDESDRAISAVHAACDLAQRVADLERLNGMHNAAWLAYQPLGDYMRALSMTRKLTVGTLGRHLGDVAIERMQAQEARIAELEAERDELRARLAEIEAQEPVATVETSGSQGAGIGWTGSAQPVCSKLYARPVPAQAVPDADAARYRWLKTRPIEVPTNGPDLALWSDSCGDALRGDDADSAIDAAMATAPEHKA